MKTRLDQRVVELGLTTSRSQAESYIKLGEVRVDGTVVNKTGFLVENNSKVELTAAEQYVSRAALKLKSIANSFNLDFRGKNVLDVGSSTGGFTDYALRHGASHVIAVEVGKNQLHPSLQGNPKIELHEQTDIRDITKLSKRVNIVVIDVSFISLRDILPHISTLVDANCSIVAMVKPQFEASVTDLKHKGVIKNDKMRRQIFKDFETWARQTFIIKDKADSEVSGSKGNKERFYLLRKV